LTGDTASTPADTSTPGALGLSPLERGCEVVFGILMTASVTAATQIGTGGQASVRELLLAAFGCNVAWGLIDAAMFLLQRQFGRFRAHRTMQELRAATDEAAFRARVREELPPVIGPALTPETYAGIRRLAEAYAPTRARFWGSDEIGAAGLIWLLVTASTAPLVVPFLVLQDAALALRLSKGVMVAMLFVLGWWIGRWSGASPWRSGGVLALGGVVLAVACIALGG
jgi:hypothetical protein